MKAKELAQLLELVVRKVVKEELKPILKEIKQSSKPIIKERAVTKPTAVKKDPLDISGLLETKKSKVQMFSENPLLNDMLNETMNDGEWRNMDAQFGSNQAQGFVGGNSNTIAPTVDIDGRPVDTNNEEVANVMGAMTKDYSALMKAIDNKKGR